MFKKFLMGFLVLGCIGLAGNSAAAGGIEAKMEKIESGGTILLQAYAANHLDEKIVIEYEFTARRVDDRGNKSISSTSGTILLLPGEVSHKLTSLIYNPPMNKATLKIFREGKLVAEKTLTSSQET